MTRQDAQHDLPAPAPEAGLGEALRARSLPRRARLDIARVALLRALTRRQAFPVRLPQGTVVVERRTLRADLARLLDVFDRESYAADYAGATVLDIGAGKGYFAVYALACGAREVRSYEQEGECFDALARAADRAPGWTVERTAVRGRAPALVRAGPHAPAGGPEPVDVVAAERILPQVAPADGRLIVRLDVEGAECDIVLGTPPSRWHVVDELFVQLHDYAPCQGDELVAHLERAGLVLRRGLDEGAGYHDLRFVREQPRHIPA